MREKETTFTSSSYSFVNSSHWNIFLLKTHFSSTSKVLPPAWIWLTMLTSISSSCSLSLTLCCTVSSSWELTWIIIIIIIIIIVSSSWEFTCIRSIRCVASSTSAKFLASTASSLLSQALLRTASVQCQPMRGQCYIGVSQWEARVSSQSRPRPIRELYLPDDQVLAARVQDVRGVHVSLLHHGREAAAQKNKLKQDL